MVYAIVATKDDNGDPEISVVPESWIDDGICWWPTTRDVTRKVKAKTVPIKDDPKKWKAYSCEIVRGNIGLLFII